MNLIAAAPAWLVWTFCAALAAAAIEDAARLRISNITCAVIAVGAVAAMILAEHSFALWQNFALFTIILALGTAAFSAGLFGGGDVKLLAASGLWLDLGGGMLLVSAVLLAGGLVAICYIAANRVRGRKTSLRSRRVPYGIAIAIGALFTIWNAREWASAQQITVSAAPEARSAAGQRHRVTLGGRPSVSVNGPSFVSSSSATKRVIRLGALASPFSTFPE